MRFYNSGDCRVHFWPGNSLGRSRQTLHGSFFSRRHHSSEEVRSPSVAFVAPVEDRRPREALEAYHRPAGHGVSIARCRHIGFITQQLYTFTLFLSLAYQTSAQLPFVRLKSESPQDRASRSSHRSNHDNDFVTQIPERFPTSTTNHIQ